MRTGAPALLAALCVSCSASLQRDPASADERERWRLQDALTTGDPSIYRQYGLLFLHGVDVPVDSERAATLLARAATAGDAEARAELAWMILEDSSLHVLSAADAITWLCDAARAGDLTAQYRLGTAYVIGLVAEPDVQLGIIWLTHAAEGGLVAAQLRLSSVLAASGGHGPQSLHWLRVAAEAGDPDAQYQLACACAGDFGAAPRSEEAVEWFEAAAGQGNRNAQYRVAMLLLDRGDTVKAEDWLYAAARAGSIDAGRALAQMFDASPDGDAERLFRMGELNEWGWNGTCKLEKAAALYKDAAQEGHAAAMYRIGRLYYYQYKAMDLDPVDSLRHATAWLRQAAPANPDAALLLGQISLNGNDARGLRRDHVEAMTWLAMAAAGGNVDATALLGWLYLGNDGVEVDRPRAVYLLSRAAAAGHARAQYSLARLCESDGCADTARLWYKRAARGRVPEAAAALARIYRDGVDCRADRDAAGAWRRYAIELGYS